MGFDGKRAEKERILKEYLSMLNVKYKERYQVYIKELNTIAQEVKTFILIKIQKKKPLFYCFF